MESEREKAFSIWRGVGGGVPVLVFPPEFTAFFELGLEFVFVDYLVEVHDIRIFSVKEVGF